VSANDTDICCRVPDQFGTLSITDEMGCDQNIFDGYFCSGGDHEPCDPEGDLCPEGECLPVYTPVCGKSTFESSHTGVEALPFTRNGTGHVSLSFSVDAIGCTDAIEGCSEDAIAGDYIKAFIAINVNCGEPGVTIYYPTITPGGSMTPDTVPSGYTHAAVAFGDALTGLACDFTIDVDFDNAGWDGHCCSAELTYTCYVKVFHADDSPAAFNIKNPSGPGNNAVVLLASVTGDCCSHPLTITIP
jgi:hypothetical protein